MKSWQIIIVAVLLAVQAYAAVDVTYSFNQQNVTVKAFNCLNTACSQVAPFSGQIIKGPNSLDGSVIIRYPDSLATPFGYAEFFISNSSFRPLVGKHNWHTNGVGGVAQTSQSAVFSKVQTPCSSSVTALNLVNTVEPFKPLSVSTLAQLDASTSSAFNLNGANGVAFIPPDWAQEYWGADTVVAFEVLNGSNVIHRQQTNFTAKNNNAVLVSSSVPVSFTYIPSAQGNFTARVTSNVVDYQCQSSVPTSAQSSFNVFLPQSQFYSLIQGLRVNNTNPRPGETVAVLFDKLTNHVSPNGTFTPVQTDVDVSVFNSTGLLVNRTITLFANPSPTVFTVQNFTFVPLAGGNHTIRVRARANSALPTTQPETFARSDITLDVQNNSLSLVQFQVLNGNTGEGIGHAVVNLNASTLQTVANGIVRFTGLVQGLYVYQVTAENFTSAQGTVNVAEDTGVTAILYPGNQTSGNTPPLFDLPGPITLLENRTISLNLSDFALDNQDADSSLGYSFEGNLTVKVSVNNDHAFFEAYAPGRNLIRFTVNDSQNVTAQDVLEIDVVQLDTAPVWTALPELFASEDGSFAQVDLSAFVSDPDSQVQDLRFSLTNASGSLFIAELVENGQIVRITPRPNAFGNGSFIVNVSDGVSFVLTDFLVNITPVADAPQVITVPLLNASNESASVRVNLSEVFFDADGDIFDFFVSPAPNLSFAFSPSQKNLTIVPDPGVFGTRQFNVTAMDSSGLNVTAEFSLTILERDDPPFLTAPLPTFTTLEDASNSIDLTPFENDFEDVSGDNNNLTWKLSLLDVINGTVPNATPVSVLDTHIFTAVLNSSTDILLIQPKGNQSGHLFLNLTLFDRAGNNVSTTLQVFVNDVNDAPVFVNLTNQSAQAGLLFTFDVNATDAENETFNFIDNSNLFDINIATGLINFTPRTTGLFEINLTVCDTSACSNGTFMLSISDTTLPSPGGQLAPANGTVFALNAVYSWGINWTDNGNVTSATFEFDNVNFTNVTRTGDFFEINLTNLSAGNHSYRWFANDTVNNTNVTNLSVFEIVRPRAELVLTTTFVVVSPARPSGGGSGTSSPFLITNDTSLNQTQRGRLNILANVTNTTGLVTISRNGVVVASNVSPANVTLNWTEAGNETVVIAFDGNQNFARSNITLNVTVLDRVAPGFGGETTLPSTPTQFRPSYLFRRLVSDNTGVDTVLLQIDGMNFTTVRVNGTAQVGTYEVNVSNLAIANHSYRWFANDSQDNQNISGNGTYTINKGVGAIALIVNGAQADTTAQVNDSVSIIANLTNPSQGIVSILINGTVEQTGPSPQVLNRTFTALGTLNITAVFAGDENASNTTVTRIITITPIVGITNVLPASGAESNFSSLILSLTTNAQTTCSFDSVDVPQAGMRRNLTTSNGTFHQANVSLVLGTNNISVACNNQSAATNTDVVYVVRNILDGTTVSGASTVDGSVFVNGTITGSVVLSNTSALRVTAANSSLTSVSARDSTILNSTLSQTNVTNTTLTAVNGSRSAIRDSSLSQCTVVNSIVKNIVANGCTFIDSFVDPSNLTGSTITGASSILESSVTFSTVANSTISFSVINNATITNSNISNSSFVNAQVVNAVIANNVLSQGSITVGGITYNAASGVANLSQVIPLAPVASFTSSSTSIRPGSTITFASTSSDANIPGPLNDSLTFAWSFGDNTTSTDSAVNKTFNSTGTFLVTLTATDRFGFSSQSSTAVTVAEPSVTISPTPSSGSGGGGGGGSGGGGGGGGLRIALSSSPASQEISIGRPVQFTSNGKLLPLSAVLRSVNAVAGTTEWVVNGKFITIAKGSSGLFDLSRDSVPDVEVVVNSLGRISATITASVPGKVSPSPVIPTTPMFNIPLTDSPPASTPAKQPVKAESKPQTTEVEVSVTAEVPETATPLGARLSEMFKKVNLDVSPDSVVVKAGIVLAIVVLGLLGFALSRSYYD